MKNLAIGTVRNCRVKKPVGIVNSTGYLIFNAERKNYLCHRIAYECYNGLIKDGFVIHHIDSNPRNNSLSNIRAISQSENTKRGRTGIYSKNAKCVKSKDIHIGKERVFQSMNEAGKYFDICMPLVRYAAEGIYKSAFSKCFKNRIQFVYI